MLIGAIVALAGCASFSHVPTAHRAGERTVYPLGIISASYAPEFEMDAALRDEWHGVKGAAVAGTPALLPCLAATAPGAWAGLPLFVCLPIPFVYAVGAYLQGDNDTKTVESMTNVERGAVGEINKGGTQGALSVALSRYLQRIDNGAGFVMLSDVPGPKAADDTPQYSPEQLRGYASLLEIGMRKFEFTGTGKKDSRACLSMSARARLLDAASGLVIDEVNLTHLAACYSAQEWLAEDGRLLFETIVNGYRLLAEDIVDEMLLIYHPERSTSEPGQKNARSEIPGFVLAPLDPPAPEMERFWFLNPTLAETRGARLASGGAHFPDVSSLTPAFAWERFPPAFDQGSDTGAKFSDPVYDLRIYSGNPSEFSWVIPLHLIHEKQGLVDPFYRLEQRLEPCSWYFWTVRARFRLHGGARSTEWGGLYGDYYPSYWRRLSVRAPSNFRYYPFRTPDQDNGDACWQ